MSLLALTYLISFIGSWAMVYSSGEATELAASLGAFSMVVGVVLALVVLL